MLVTHMVVVGTYRMPGSFDVSSLVCRTGIGLSTCGCSLVSDLLCSVGYGPLQADRQKVCCQSPKSGTNISRTSVSIRCTRDMETTCIYGTPSPAGGGECTDVRKAK